MGSKKVGIGKAGRGKAGRGKAGRGTAVRKYLFVKSFIKEDKSYYQ